MILPDSTILTDYLLEKTTSLVDKMFVYPERMRRNLELTRGLVFSGQLLLDLAAAGMLREQAYAIVQRMPWKPGRTKAISARPSKPIRKLCVCSAASKLAETFSLERQLKHVDAIFDRVFSD